jgi:hypothetical protein
LGFSPVVYFLGPLLVEGVLVQEQASVLDVFGEAANERGNVVSDGDPGHINPF